MVRGQKIIEYLHYLLTNLKLDGLLHGSAVKILLPANAEDTGSIPGLGRSPGGGNGNSLQYSCLGLRTEEPGGLRSKGSQTVRHDLVTQQ